MDGLSALAQCHEIATASHSSFITSFRFLPAEKRQALEIIYAFMRVTDDLADESPPAYPSYPVFSPQTETVPEGSSLKDDFSVSDFTVRKKERLIYWKKQIESSVAPSVESFGVSSPEVSGVLSAPDDSQSQQFYNDKLLQKGLSILPAVRKVIREYSIPVVNLLNVIDGVLEDTNMPVQMPTLADSLRYCDLVAGAVGFSILPILGIYVPLDDQRLEQSALAFGRAFQWTNFLRDLQEDFSQNRFYFPQTDFRQFELTQEDFLTEIHLMNSRKFSDFPFFSCQRERHSELRLKAQFHTPDTPFYRFFQKQFIRTETFYQESQNLMELVEKKSRPVLMAMKNVYYRLFQKIKARPWIVFRQRIRLSRLEKMFCLWSVLLSSFPARPA